MNNMLIMNNMSLTLFLLLVLSIITIQSLYVGHQSRKQQGYINNSMGEKYSIVLYSSNSDIELDENVAIMSKETNGEEVLEKSAVRLEVISNESDVIECCEMCIGMYLSSCIQHYLRCVRIIYIIIVITGRVYHHNLLVYVCILSLYLTSTYIHI